MIPSVHIRWLGCASYTQTWHAMQAFSQHRESSTEDELWICQHPAVFTQGQAGETQHLGQLGDIPLIQTDRGGQVTFHGPGQWVFYPLIDLTRLKLGVKSFVHLIEQVTIDTLAPYNICVERLEGAPGLYVQGKKIASLGLKIKRGCSYHGLALNVDMDLSPFERITPCGLSNMKMTQCTEHTHITDMQHIATDWVSIFSQQLSKRTPSAQV